MTLCAKCKKNPAVFFITKMENGKTTSEGLCLSCAKELGIAPINQMIDNFGVSDEELAARREKWVCPPLKEQKGCLNLFARNCRPAEEGGAMQPW